MTRTLALVSWLLCAALTGVVLVVAPGEWKAAAVAPAVWALQFLDLWLEHRRRTTRRSPQHLERLP